MDPPMAQSLKEHEDKWGYSWNAVRCNWLPGVGTDGDALTGEHKKRPLWKWNSGCHSGSVSSTKPSGPGKPSGVAANTAVKAVKIIGARGLRRNSSLPSMLMLNSRQVWRCGCCAFVPWDPKSTSSELWTRPYKGVSLYRDSMCTSKHSAWSYVSLKKTNVFFWRLNMVDKGHFLRVQYFLKNQIHWALRQSVRARGQHQGAESIFNRPGSYLLTMFSLMLQMPLASHVFVFTVSCHTMENTKYCGWKTK